MKKKYIVLLFLLIFCSQESSIEEVDLTTTSMMEQSQALDEDTTTTTSVEIVQLETFEDINVKDNLFLITSDGYLTKKEITLLNARLNRKKCALTGIIILKN